MVDKGHRYHPRRRPDQRSGSSKLADFALAEQLSSENASTDWRPVFLSDLAHWNKGTASAQPGTVIKFTRRGQLILQPAREPGGSRAIRVGLAR